ncbi:AMP-binding protein [Salicibibacter cibarius]|uniref:AMP-binding protein n=1 Tax=Salicibibacter cibarius TaxID=2743000 RepID=A0A7T6Z3A5_9BACI|nr:AMP-binding protein [Salicibibacter cibarius]QQK76200.1 AMP-binding protein [Salicibibacter cibarius]
MNVAKGLSNYAKHHPADVAIVARDEKRTYKAFDKTTDKIARRLIAYSNYENFRAAFLIPNNIRFLELFIGAAKAGWTAVTLDPKWTTEELEKCLKNTSLHLLFVDSTLEHKIASLSFDRERIICSNNDRWLNEGPEQIPLPDLTGEEPFYIGFTSGSTGTPKGYIRSHHSWVESFAEGKKELPIKKGDRVLVSGSLVHSLFLYAALHTLDVGATCYLSASPKPERLADEIQKHEITVMYGVPTMYFRMAKNESRTFQCLHTLITSGAKMSSIVTKSWRKIAPNANWIDFYGSSEHSFIAILHHAEEANPSAIGRPFSSVSIDIKKEEGDVGELFVSSPMVFSGYDGGETVSPASWIPTGDYVWKDREGILHLAGRKQNKIVTGGLNVYSEEVEEVLRSHVDVQDVVVTGIHHHEWGEQVTAVLEIKNHRPLTDHLITLLIETCKMSLASYKCPKHWLHMDPIPLTTSGKPKRSTVKAWAVKREEKNE